MAKPELKRECVRLRVEERLSLREIHERTGASKGSLSRWLREHPLTKDELTFRKSQKEYSPAFRKTKKSRGEVSRLYLMAGSKLSRLQKAKIAEAAVMLRMCIQDYNVFGSVFDGDKTDWLVELPDGSVKKVQVKWAMQKKEGLPVVSLTCSSSGRYREGDFDFIIGYDLYSDTAYVWSWDEVAHLKTGVSVCPEACERWDKMHEHMR